MRVSYLFRSSCLTALLVLSACAVGPDFERPVTAAGAEFDSTALPETTNSTDDEHGNAQRFSKYKDIPAEWWQVFKSESLNTLIRQSLKANPDLEAAKAALRQAQENTLAQTGALLPTFGVEYDTNRQQTTGAAAGGAFPGTLFTLHRARVNVSYGIDLWGGTRRAVEELDATSDYQRFQLEAAYLSLTSNVVTTAVQEASLRGQIAATKQVLEQEDRQIKLTQSQLDLGAITKAPLLALQTTREQTRATLPGLEHELAKTRHLLSVLVGELPSSAPQATFTLDQIKLPEDLPVTIPSQLVDQRPDVRAAEANLHAASAAIGVAVANRLPQLNITGNIGSQANLMDNLFKSGTGIWSLGLALTQTFFDGGTLAHRQGAAEAAYDQAAAQYRKTVLGAFQDVADVLHALQSDADELKNRVEAQRVAAASLALFKQQYEAGSASYLDVLSAEQAEAQTKIALVQAKAQRLADTAALFQALGGGWWNRTTDISDNSRAEDKSEPPANPAPVSYFPY